MIEATNNKTDRIIRNLYLCSTDNREKMQQAIIENILYTLSEAMTKDQMIEFIRSEFLLEINDYEVSEALNALKQEGGIDNAVMKQLKDMNAQYRHGGGSSSVPHRRLYGAMQAYADFDKIINAISDETGAITETIKIVTHSMGAAYGKGYVAELKKQLKKRGYDKKVLITLVADFDPYQADALYRDSQIKTQQFTHKGIMADQKQRNLSDDDYYEDRRKSNHSIRSFYDDIFKLREGTYVWDGTQWLLQN